MNRRRTVLMTADAIGGIWTYVLQLAQAFEALDADTRVVLAVLGERPKASQLIEARRCNALHVHAWEGRLEWMDDPWDDVARSGEWLLALEREVRPDVVHSNMYVHSALPFRAPVVTVAHSCVASWWTAVKKEPLPARYHRYRTEVARGLHAARAVVAPTYAMRDALQAHYGQDLDVRVIYNGAPCSAAPAREKSPLIFSSGRLWDEAKNVEALSAVAPFLPWPIHLAGDASGPDGTTRELPRVRALGWLRRQVLDACLATAAIYAHPARYEPFGLSPLEAAHAGCALVLGDIPSLREVWGDDAFYAAPEDHDALAAALLALIQDAPLRTSMGARAQRRARAFLPERQARAYLALYDELVI